MDLSEAIRQTLDVAMRDADWEIYDCDGPGNGDRASWGRAAWVAHQTARDGVYPRDVDSPLDYEVADVICDLLHLAAESAGPHDASGGLLAVLRSALGNFSGEAVHAERCPDCGVDEGPQAAASAAIVGVRVITPRAERGVVVAVVLDERDGDLWRVRPEGSARLATYRAEECHVTDDEPEA